MESVRILVRWDKSRCFELFSTFVTGLVLDLHRTTCLFVFYNRFESCELMQISTVLGLINLLFELLHGLYAFNNRSIRLLLFVNQCIMQIAASVTQLSASHACWRFQLIVN